MPQRDELDRLAEVARDLLQRDGELVPMLFICRGAHVIEAAAFPMPPLGPERREFMWLLGATYRDQQPDRIVLISDVYLRMQRSGETLPIGSTAELPGREEALLVAELDADGISRTRLHPYVRGSRGIRFRQRREDFDERITQSYLLGEFFNGVRG